ncbi:MAG TPA: VCBS repeat-containing protein, partial [Tepidisphaeraceae bacterium]|nr:VCBS repeat-containing protein [Tepidisphaeraceae bacterium]
VQEADLARTFPGRTAALVRIVAEIKDRKPALLNAIQDNVFRGPIKELAKLNLAKPTFLSAADFNGDQQSDLLVGTDAGPRLLLGSDKGFVDASEPWGLKSSPAPSQPIGLGDINSDGKPDLFLSSTIWINQGNTFIPFGKADLPGGGAILAIAFADATSDKLADLLVLQSTGQVTALVNPGKTGQTWAPRPLVKLWDAPADAPLAATFGYWDDDDSICILAVRNDGVLRYALNNTTPAADFRRLTGEKPEAFRKAFPNGLKAATALAGDFTADGRPDCLIVSDNGALLLVNRGFGAYFVNPDISAALRPSADRPVPFNLSSSLRYACVTSPQALLVLRDDGTLYQVPNAPPKP